ncbi:MAG: ABC transporter permease [Candidatus Latescibacteria bacterium]|nr:ABC transporter permease [Candidatus Latescibacterota bacterium]
MTATTLRSAAEGKSAEQALGSLSQKQLIWRGFARHRLAMASFYLLAVMYTLALGCEFFAPYSPQWKNLDFAYCPPQPLRFDFEHGLHVRSMRQSIDPITLKKNYIEDPADIISFSFFAKGESYELMGLLAGDRHFLGVDEISNKGTGTAPPFFILGADRYGRDILSRIIYGTRISLSVGIVAIAVTFILGLSIGGVSGYVGGRTDNLIQRTIEIINAFPQLPLWLALGASMPPEWSPLRTYFAITIVLSLLSWTGLARVVRGKLLSLREEDFAVAARLLGADHGRIIFRHLLPGFTSHIIVVLTLTVPAMILGETSLSFLGLGLRPPVVSWGVMLRDCMKMEVVANYPWLLFPLSFIVITVLCFNFVGDGMRDAADPYASR